MMVMERTDLFNQEVKERYLDSIDNEVSKQIYGYTLKKAKEYEELKNKDIYDMTIDELEELFYSMKPTSVNASYHNFVRIGHYIEWAIKNGFSKSNISPFDGILNTVDYNKKFVARYMNTYFTRKEILKIVRDFINAVDGALLLAIFEGIGGKGYSELLNLKKEDVVRNVGLHPDYWTVNLQDGDKKRTIKISEELAKKLIEADGEPDYLSHNGEIEDTRSRHINDYEPSEFIFKRVNKGAKRDGGLDGFFVQRKFTFFKKILELEYLKPRNITQSGMMAMADALYKENEDFGREELHEIAEQFDAPINNYGDRNTSVIKRIVMDEEFEQLYGYALPL